jgi:CheY-like chemotaxis protein
MLMGHEARAATCGAAALQAAEQAAPQVVLLDLKCPTATVLRCCGPACAQRAVPDLSHCGDDGLRPEGRPRQHPCRRLRWHLTKPVDVAQLRDMLLAASEPKR